MRDVVYLDRLEQAEALLKPMRVEVLRRLAEPHSCTEVAKQLGQTPQRVYYHVKQLVAVGLAELVSERRVRGINEGVYQAVARSYWLSPALVGRLGPRRSEDRLSLGYLLSLVEEVQADIANLDRTAPDLPSLGISGQVCLPEERRPEFLADLREAMQGLFEKYGGAEGSTFRVALVCYPAAQEPPAAPTEAPTAAPTTGPQAPGPAADDGAESSNAPKHR
ncbi:ArsR family transcriptional regulator [Spongiactinospora gelatinilytica]|uniref:ArsR family transcriptional regulator n=1 Tax=Spongiactinospora gelatinilytica TaxID=2666298 RepID=A0A2W2HC81_9ACTN|nr:helix-turn-helix domain-containing protein [Spongiactinospora gelatinilytica]PZG43837.1 ArsR family transcriptional regulator [Spongiactinospora gelatinilytica]